MQPTKDRASIRQKGKERKRPPYKAPAIIYEGAISIRAGTPPPPGGFPNPGSPFDAPRG